MRTAFSATIDVTEQRLYQVVSDLGTYPAWLDVVDSAEPTENDGPEPAWFITLKARVGPFARSKRLRMVRTGADGTTVLFDRRELDGKDHSSWSMTATVANGSGAADEAAPPSSKVTIDLDYDGPMWSGLLDGVLAAAAARATEQLKIYLAEPN